MIAPQQLAGTWQIISGSERILAYKARLQALAKSCAQGGALDFLEYFLAAPYFDLEVPSILTKTLCFLPERMLRQRSRRPALLLRRGQTDITAAVLLWEYKVMGLATRCYVPLDDDGYRCVIAPEQEKNQVAVDAGALLLRRGALLVLVSVLTHSHESPISLPTSPAVLGTQCRRVGRKLHLGQTMEETLASLSRNLRHNLRRSRLQLNQSHGAVYVPHAVLSSTELLELNQSCVFSVPCWAAEKRYALSSSLEHGFVSGLHDAGGRWLSLVGAHREADTVCLDWQMNRSGLGSISVATGMRGFLIEEEVNKGTRWLRFERGTTHPIQGAFLEESTYDFLCSSPKLPARLIQRLTRNAKGGALATVMASPSLVWRR